MRQTSLIGAKMATVRGASVAQTRENVPGLSSVQETAP